MPMQPFAMAVEWWDATWRAAVEPTRANIYSAPLRAVALPVSLILVVARDRLQPDLAYGVLIGDSVLGCVAATFTLCWSDLKKTEPKRIKVATTAASTSPMGRSSSVTSRPVSLLVGPLGMISLHAPVLKRKVISMLRSSKRERGHATPSSSSVFILWV